MQKAMVWAVAVALVWFGVLATPVLGQDDVIQIKVGRDLIDDPNKAMMPIPQFTFGGQLLVEVEWVEPAEGLILTLSDFRLVALNPDADYEDDEVIWPWDPMFELQLMDVDRNLLKEVSFSFLDADRDSKGPVTRKLLILERIGTPRDHPIPQLILFKQTLSQVLFVHDPPWVGKPPMG